MLKSIACDAFREKKINFHQGLNIILGDNIGSNSIGKSTLLMIIDFAFGGIDYIEKNKDVTNEMGIHTFNICFEFDGKEYYFQRKSDDKKEVSVCNEKYEVVDNIQLSEYNKFLHEKYIKDLNDISFRSAVNIFSRIWQKNNFFEKKPLKVVERSADQDGILNLLKLFNKYSSIKGLENEINDLSEKLSTINSASKFQLLNRITKVQYDENLKNISSLTETLRKLALDLSIKMEDLVQMNNSELQDELHELNREENLIQNKLRRTEKSIQKNINIEKSSFLPLKEFFPDADLKHLEDISLFHNGMASILKENLINEKKKFEQDLAVIQDNIAKVKTKLASSSNAYNIPEQIVAPLVSTISEINQKRAENAIYDDTKKDKMEKKAKETALSSLKQEAVSSIVQLINSNMENLNNDIYHGNSVAPQFYMDEQTYHLSIVNNTGTARAFTNLIIFDISVLRLTKLPFLIHDNVMFKNISNIAMNDIIALYDSLSKQHFIVLDEMKKYDETSQDIITKKKVIQLSSESTLFTKDWSRLR